MKKFLSVIFSLALCVSVFGQAEEITEKVYDDIISSAQNKFSNNSYRAKSKLTVFDDGKVYLTIDWERAFIKPNKKYYKNIRISNGETEKLEQIQIGNLTFCRKNNAKWEKSKKSCEASSLSAISKIEDSKFSSEKAKLKDEDVRTFEKYFIYSSFSNAANKFFTRRRSWISKDGFLLREEIENGALGEELPNKEVIVYEYNSKDLKIEAPIK